MVNKASYLPFSVVVFFVFLFSCEQAVDKELTPGKITFGFSGNVDGRVAEGFNPKAILISVVNANGVSIANLKRMELYNFSGSYLTNEELELLPGSYSITQLLVVDESNAVTHVLPVEGSQHAHLVEDAAPIHFSVGSGEHKTQTIQVVKVEGSANEYGYVTFEVEEITTLHRKLKEIRVNDGGRVLNFYNSHGLIKRADHYYCYPDFNNCDFLGSANFEYDDQNRIAHYYYLGEFEGDTTQSKKYFYDYLGLLSRVVSKNYYSPTFELTYLYSSTGKLSHALLKQLPSYNNNHTKVEFSSSGEYLIETSYKVIGEIKKKSMEVFYKTDGKNSLEIELGYLGVESVLLNPVFQGNVTELRYNHYDANQNLIYSCIYTSSFNYNSDGYPVVQNISNPDGCFGGISYGVYSFIYY